MPDNQTAGKVLVPISVKSLSACHVGLHFAVEHALSAEQAEQFRQVRREIFFLIRNAVREVEANNDAPEAKALAKWNAQADQWNQWDSLGQDEKDELTSKESRPAAPTRFATPAGDRGRNGSGD